MLHAYIKLKMQTSPKKKETKTKKPKTNPNKPTHHHRINCTREEEICGKRGKWNFGTESYSFESNSF